MENGFTYKRYLAILLLQIAITCCAAHGANRVQLTHLSTAVSERKETLIRNLCYRATYPLCTGDIYSPKSASKALPAVIVVHGGAWRAGRKEDFDATAASMILMRENFVVFNINYRLTPDGGEFPNNVEDVKHAIAYLKKNATKYCVNVQRIGIFGTSAGGHLALMAAYAPNATFGIKEKETVKAVVAFCPLTDLKQVEVAFVAQYIGCMLDQCKDVWDKASPVSYVQTSVPTLLVHGGRDRTVPIQQSAHLAELLKLNHTRVEMIEFPKSDHIFSVTNGEERVEASDAMVRFFKENL
ncbi:MAG TPA: alpha/beta hydrolase [Drouetiella sp.]|jgi:acetyl esterase/lipase